MFLRRVSLAALLAPVVLFATVPAQEPPRVSRLLFSEMKWRNIGPQVSLITWFAYRFSASKCVRSSGAESSSSPPYGSTCVRPWIVKLLGDSRTGGGCAPAGATPHTIGNRIASGPKLRTADLTTCPLWPETRYVCTRRSG